MFCLCLSQSPHCKRPGSYRRLHSERASKEVFDKHKSKSAITDHADRRNCVIDWEGAKVEDKETNRCARWIKKATWIRKTKPTMNRDEGGTDLVTFGAVCSPRHLASSDH